MGAASPSGHQAWENEPVKPNPEARSVLSFSPQRVGHRVEAGPGRPAEPKPGPHGAPCEALAALCPMGKSEPLAMAEKVDRVVAHDVTTAQRHHADLVVAPLTDRALTPRNLRALEPAPDRLRDGAAERERRAARGVYLHAMVDLGDLGIEAGAEQPGRIADELQEHVHAAAHLCSAAPPRL